MRSVAAIAVWLLLAAIPSTATLPLPNDDVRCLETMNKEGAAVVKAQGKQELRCLKDAAKGKEPNAQACVTGDPKGKIAKARQKLEAGEAKRCADAAPPFGYTDSTTVGDAAVGERTGLTSDVFGPDLGAAAVTKASSKPDAACQAAVAKGVDKLTAALFGTATKAQKDLFKGKNSPLPLSSAELADALLSAVSSDPKGKIARATSKLASGAEKKCSTADPAVLFPGTCAATGAASDLSTCLTAATRCRFCVALGEFGALDLACDEFDDAATNGSCGGDEEPTAMVTATDPAEGASDVPPGDWLALEFDIAPPRRAWLNWHSTAAARAPPRASTRAPGRSCT